MSPAATCKFRYRFLVPLQEQELDNGFFVMDERRLNILAIFPTDEPFWRAGEKRLRRNLSQHNLQFAYSVPQAAASAGEAEVVLCISMVPLPDQYARQASRLKWIQALGVGVDGIVGLPSLGPDVIITNARGIHGAPVSEAALGLMFSLARDVRRSIRHQAERRWAPFIPTLLEGKTIGILGTGVIGQALGRKCQALGMTVLGITATPRHLAGFDSLHPREDLIPLAGQLDYFVLVTPLTPATQAIVNTDVLRAMKPTAFLINVGRGALVDEAALAAALQEGSIAGAGLDCFAREPLPPDSPLWSLENVVLTPHMAGRHDGYMDDALEIFEVNLRHYLSGETADMVNLVSRESSTGPGGR